MSFTDLFLCIQQFQWVITKWIATLLEMFGNSFNFYVTMHNVYNVTLQYYNVTMYLKIAKNVLNFLKFFLISWNLTEFLTNLCENY